MSFLVTGSTFLEVRLPGSRRLASLVVETFETLTIPSVVVGPLTSRTTTFVLLVVVAILWLTKVCPKCGTCYSTSESICFDAHVVLQLTWMPRGHRPSGGP